MVAPGRFQWRMWWAALTALALVVLAGTFTGVGWLVVKAMGFLQPVLMPLAVAGILAYLLNPVVDWLEKRRRIGRTWAVVAVFGIFFLAAALVALWIVPSLYRQGVSLVQNFPGYTERAQQLFTTSVEQARRLAELPILRGDAEGEGGQLNDTVRQGIDEAIAWIRQQTPTAAAAVGKFLARGVGGALGAFGFLLSLVLVPIFLFFFLKDGPRIAETWSNYLPLRASPLKSEVVSLLNEINNYLIAFFRGQLLVSLIDGAIIAVALLVMRMEFAVLIGLMVGILGLIPYAGVIISWVPAVIIAASQWNDWTHPIIVTVIFLVVNNLDGLVIAPRIVGESVGLHPLTVIVSVLVWSIVLGGLLGALLAVPLTATMKVVLKRYFWDKPGPEAATSPPG
jgi:Predicted permease